MFRNCEAVHLKLHADRAAILLGQIGLSEKSAALLIEEHGELEVQRHTMYCLWMMDQGKVHVPPAWLTASLKGDWNAPPDVRTLEDLLPMVDQIAGVISQGYPARQRQVLSVLFERTEVLDGKITKAKPRDWARPLFNGGNGIYNEDAK